MLQRFQRDRRLLWTMLALFVVAGLDAYRRLPRMEDPRFSSRFECVVTDWPGAPAQRVEAMVTDRIEDALIGLREIDSIASESKDGVSALFVALDDAISGDAATDAAWSRVRARLDEVRSILPEGAGTPALSDRQVFANTMLIALSWSQEDAPVSAAILGRRARELEERMRAVPGTESTRVFGLAPEEVRIELDPERLTALGLTVAEVAERLSGLDAKRAAGRVEVEDARLLLEVSGAPDRLDDLRNARVALGPDGRSILLSDIARVDKTADTDRAEAVIADGRRAVVVAARMAPDRRTDRWAVAAREAIATFEASLSSGLEVGILFDQSRYTERRLGDLRDNFLLGVVAVVLSTLIMMGWRSAVLAGLVLPLVVLVVLAGMKLLGVPIQQMSITGLIVALGILIDNVIVMMDEVRHRLDAGADAGTAVRGSLERLAVPLGGSTLTTVLGFLPIVRMTGSTGEFVGSIGICVVLAVTASLALTLAVVPALTVGLSALGARRSDEASVMGRRGWLDQGIGGQRIYRAYHRILGWLLARPRTSVSLALAGPIFGFAAVPSLPEQFFPSADRDMFQVQIRLPQQCALDATLAAAGRARRVLMEIDGVESVHWFAGSVAPAFYYNLPVGEHRAPYFAQALVQLESGDATRQIVQAAQRALDLALPDVQALAFELAQGPAVLAPLALRVTGPDLDVLASLGHEVRSILAGVPGVIHTRATLSGGRPTAQVELDDAAARRAGLDNAGVAELLDDSLSGVDAGTFVEGSEELPVRVRVGRTARSSVAATSLDLGHRGARPDGGLGNVTLDSVGAIAIRPSWAAIPRRDGARVNEVLGYIEAGRLPAEAEACFRERLEAAGFAAPAGYQVEFVGEVHERDDAVSSLLGTASVLLVLMVASLILATRSFRLAVLVFGVGALAVGLGLGALAVSGYPFCFMAILGLLGLIGIAINDAIVVLSLLRADRRAMAGDAAGVRDVVFRATRHVLTTTLTTATGFLPLMVSGGEFWPPLAVVVAGGVVGATLVALTLVPTVFLAIARSGRPLDATSDLTPAYASFSSR